MTAASEVKTCRQHPGGCRPWDRHTQSLRSSDELMAAVEEKAWTMGLVKNDGLEMALEEWVGWREPGLPWKGPRRKTPAYYAPPAAHGASSTRLRDMRLAERSERQAADLAEARAALGPAQARAAAAEQRADEAERRAKALTRELEAARRRERDRQIVDAYRAGESGVFLAEEHHLTRQRIHKIVSDAAPEDAPPEQPPANPGSAVFMEPGGKPVVAAVPERKRARKS